jgi:hypothetical protein
MPAGLESKGLLCFKASNSLSFSPFNFCQRNVNGSGITTFSSESSESDTSYITIREIWCGVIDDKGTYACALSNQHI